MRLTSKGQVTIPQEIRETLGLLPHTEVEFEIDTNRTGQTWHVKIKDNGTTIFNQNRTTQGRSGSFSVELKTANRAGTDTIKAKATRNGTTCSGTVRI